MTSVVDACGNVTFFTYDLAGNKLSQTDGKRNTTGYQYNVAGLIIKEIKPGTAPESARTTSCTYYADGKLRTKTDRNGATATYTYDIHGRRISEIITPAGSTTPAEQSRITYTYDKAGNLLTMEDSTGVTIRTYDELGRVLTKTVPNIGTILFDYDIKDSIMGKVIEKSLDPKGNVTVKTFDSSGRLEKVVSGNDVTIYSYYLDGSKKSITYYKLLREPSSKGYSQEYSYNKDGTISYLTNRKPDGTQMDVTYYDYEKGNMKTRRGTQKRSIQLHGVHL